MESINIEEALEYALDLDNDEYEEYMEILESVREETWMQK